MMYPQELLSSGTVSGAFLKASMEHAQLVSTAILRLICIAVIRGRHDSHATHRTCSGIPGTYT